MVTQRKSIPLKRTMVTFSTSTEYHRGRSGSNKIAAQVHDRWCSCSMVYWVLRQTGSPTYPTKALASFWLMRGLMFGWEMCEEIPMAFVISSSRCIRISFGILGNLFFFHYCCRPTQILLWSYIWNISCIEQILLILIIWQTQSSANPCALIGSFSVRILQFPWKRSDPCIFVLEQSRQI